MTTLIAPQLSKAKFDRIVEFYAASDARNVEKYLEFLTPNVNFILGLKPAHGHPGVRSIRESMWHGVDGRKHTPRSVFVGADGEGDIMLFGEVAYALTNGKRVVIDFSARMVFGEGEDSLRMTKYQVWLDPSRLIVAMTE